MKEYLKQLLSDGADPSFLRHAMFVSLPVLLFCLAWAVVIKWEPPIIPVSGAIAGIFACKAIQSKYEKKEP